MVFLNDIIQKERFRTGKDKKDGCLKIIVVVVVVVFFFFLFSFLLVLFVCTYDMI